MEVRNVKTSKDGIPLDDNLIEQLKEITIRLDMDIAIYW